MLAEKRCADFGTCTGGVSQVNTQLFPLFDQGKNLLHYDGKSTCGDVRPVLDDIIRLMTVPLVQGVLRYAWKVGTTNGAFNDLSEVKAKNHAEGATFAQALLPLVHHCDAAAAKVVSDNMKFDGQTFAVGTINPMTGTTPDTAAVKAALESTYPCLGITCAHVGGLLKNDNDLAGGYKTGMDPCSHKPYIAGYHPGSNVVQHNQIDLDQKAIEDAVVDGASQDFALAKSVYTSGGVNTANGGFNSMSKGKARTLQGFSTNAKARMYDDCAGPYKTYKKFYDYYGDYVYADKWVLAALDGTEYVPANAGTTHAPGFKSTDLAARKEAVQKGTAYQNVWMYAIREFEDAIDDCMLCTSDCNEFSDSVNKTGQYNAVHAWDEGVAFYTGSLVGTTLDADTPNGQMVFMLAEKRGEDFGTYTGGLSQVNTELFPLFAQGRDLLHYEGKSTCGSVRPVLDDIIRLMTVPLVQGVLRYAWKG